MAKGTTAALKPDVPSFGYAALLSINATSIWGGIFPYLPSSCQTPETTIAFYTAQIAAFLATFCAALALTWQRPGPTRNAHALAFGLPLAAGPLMLVAAMYAEAAAPGLIGAAAVLIGVGSAGYLMGWQRVFAAMDAARGNLALIKGTGASALLYFAICLIPAALTAYLIPLVMVPLAGLCLWLAANSTSSDQPMFQDVPREHAVVYVNALRESVRPALSIGALGFCSGAVRFIAVTHQELLSAINLFSMFALLAVVAAFFVAWRARTVRFDLMSVFRVLFPVVATFMVVLPFAGASFADAGFGVSYACFMLACVLMMMHCGQISRDSGINPVLIFAFYSAVAYALQMTGYLVGYASGSGSVLGVEQLSLVALVALYVLLLVALVGRSVRKLHTGRLEFLMLTPDSEAARASTSAEIARGAGEGVHRGARWERDGMGDEGSGAGTEAGAAEVDAAGGGGRPADRTALRCRELAGRYSLTGREAEVMELIVRGHSGPAIAAMLVISENTMRTHSKRIYAKLGVHKKQELIALVESAGAAEPPER